MTLTLLVLFNESESLVLLKRNNVEVLLVDCLSFSAGEKSLDPRFVEVHVCLLASDVNFSVCHCIKCSIGSPTDLKWQTNLNSVNWWKQITELTWSPGKKRGLVWSARSVPFDTQKPSFRFHPRCFGLKRDNLKTAQFSREKIFLLSVRVNWIFCRSSCFLAGVS